ADNNDDRRIAQPDPKQTITHDNNTAVVKEDRLQKQKIDTGLKLAENLFAAGNVKGLANLFEVGSTETKLAVANYLSKIGTDAAMEALKSLDILNDDEAVQKEVLQILEEISQETAQAGIDPNTASEQADQTTDELEKSTVPDIEGFLGIKVVDAESGKIIEGALLKTRSNIKTLQNLEMKTNKFGRVLYEIGTQEVSYFNIKVKSKGYVSKYLYWRPDSKGIPVPKQHLIQMNKSVPIGGYVKTKEGQPIEGVSVNINTEFTYQFTEFDYIQETVKTDKDGRWFLEDFDSNASEASISLKHAEYVSMDKFSETPNIELLLNQTCVLFMQKGFTVSGYVRAADGTPIEGAMLYEGWSRFTEDKGKKTDAQGYYQFDKCHQGRLILTVVAKGYAQDMKEFPVGESLSNVDFVLEPGYTLPVRVLDHEEKPLQGVKIQARYWRHFKHGQKCESIRCSAQTDANGRAILNDLPSDEVLYTIRKDGFATLNKYPLTPSDEEQVITLWPQGKLKGNVYDAQTGELVREFTMTQGIQWQGQKKPTWQSQSGKVFYEGQYEQPFNYHLDGCAVKIEADGYLIYESETFFNEGKEVTLDIHLNKGENHYGVVYDSDGKPAKNADVLVCLKDGWVRIEKGRFDQTSHLRLKTNGSGEFALPPQHKAYMLIILHEKGVGRISEEQFIAAYGEIHLQKWGRIKGTVYSGRKPDVNCKIIVQVRFEDGHEYSIIDNTQIYSDDKGQFSFNRVLPGRVTIHKAVKVDGSSTKYANTSNIEVLPGETKEVHLGGGGRAVTGRFLRPGAMNIDFANYRFDIMPSKSDLREKGLDFSNLPEMPFPEDFFLRTPEEMQAWQAEWMQTPDGQEWMKISQKLSENTRTSFRPDYVIVIDEQGNFRIEDVLPGNYAATVRFRDPGINPREPEYYNTFIAEVEFEFTVKDAEDEKEFEIPIDAGRFSLQPIQSLQVGQLAPDIAIKDFEGKKRNLQNYRGKYILLDLAGSRYLGSQNKPELEVLKEIYSAYHHQVGLDIISIIPGGAYPESWTSVRRAWKYFFGQKGMQWTVAFEDRAMLAPSLLQKDYTLEGRVPEFVLLAPDGKVAEIIPKADALLEKIQEYFEATQ
ncbi:MAG: carboxypeptidase regulatory-like domain-containing protein, partial [Planctomycetota bacterium]